MSLIFATQLTAIATTVLAVFAIVTAAFAILAFLKQSKEVRDQVEMLKVQSGQLELQSQQLNEQREINALQVADLRESLRERARQRQVAEREQADKIDIRPGPRVVVLPGSQSPSKVHSAEVANGSRRPIRNIACRIETAPGSNFEEARLADTYKEATTMRSGPPRRVFTHPAEASRIPLIRAGEEGAFAFAADFEQYPEARMTVRFTDDAGLHWQINNDLHLDLLNDRDW